MRKLVIFFIVLVSGISFGDTIFIDSGVHDNIELYQDDNLIMTGGSVSYLDMFEDSTAEVSNGQTVYFFMYDYSVSYFYGGELSYLALGENAETHLYNVQIGSLLSAHSENVEINVYGNSFQYEPTGGQKGDGLISGYWGNGTAFSISLYNQDDIVTYDKINFINIPEPFSLVLFSLSGLFQLKKK